MHPAGPLLWKCFADPHATAFPASPDFPARGILAIHAQHSATNEENQHDVTCAG